MSFTGQITRLSELIADYVIGARLQTATDDKPRIVIGDGPEKLGAINDRIWFYRATANETDPSTIESSASPTNGHDLKIKTGLTTNMQYPAALEMVSGDGGSNPRQAYLTAEKVWIQGAFGGDGSADINNVRIRGGNAGATNTINIRVPKRSGFITVSVTSYLGTRIQRFNIYERAGGAMSVGGNVDLGSEGQAPFISAYSVVLNGTDYIDVNVTLNPNGAANTDCYISWSYESVGPGY